jgi:mannose-6-phosphate isomerase
MYVPPFEEELMREFDRRPWGTYTVLEEAPNFKVKRIEVLPGKRLSYQKHSQRAEHWFVVAGTARVTLDGSEIIVHTGEAIDIPIGSAHRVENPGDDDLIFIEVQRGTYLGEDDIVRLEDDYGRTG